MAEGYPRGMGIHRRGIAGGFTVKLIDIEMAAKRLAVSPSTVRRMLDEGGT
jgi:hypothetical protein